MTALRAQTLLKVENVTLKFGDKTVLHNVNAEIKNVVRPGLTQGQVVGFLGPSGRGKTQLFRILSGLNKPTSGRVLVGPNLEPVRVVDVGVVDQHYTLFDHRTVGDNLMIAGRMAGLNKKAAREKADYYLGRFQLQGHWNEYPQRLSGGQRQRIAICQQIMCSRGYLLMDEPFSGLDPNMKREAEDLISEVASLDELFTIIVITHDIGSAMRISDTLWVLGWREPTGVEGATLLDEIDLIKAGLAYDKDIEKNPAYQGLRNAIIDKFKTL